MIRSIVFAAALVCTLAGTCLAQGRVGLYSSDDMYDNSVYTDDYAGYGAPYPVEQFGLFDDNDFYDLYGGGVPDPSLEDPAYAPWFTSDRLYDQYYQAELYDSPYYDPYDGVHYDYSQYPPTTNYGDYYTDDWYSPDYMGFDEF